MNAELALILALLLPALASRAQTSSVLAVDFFSDQAEADGRPLGWQRLIFRPVARMTEYKIVHEDAEYYVRALSSGAGTGIFKEVDLSLADRPILSWRWKVDQVLEKADAKRKSGDDFAARVYVAFRYEAERAGVLKRWKYKVAKKQFGSYPPEAALIYVWDNKQPAGSLFDNAFTSRAKMIVLESGPQKAGQWVSERRDVYADYKKAFGGEPPRVHFVALMTDTDNTGEAAVAYYDDIAFSSAAADPR